PESSKFLDVEGLSALTHHPVRVQYQMPGQQDALPGPDAIAVIPATFNTINKWALGIADTLADGLVSEHMGRGIPSVGVPYLKNELARPPAFPKSVRMLKRCGVRVLYEPKRYPSPQLMPWERVLSELPSQKRVASRDETASENGLEHRPSTYRRAG